MKVIEGKFGVEAPTGKDKVQQALKKFEDAGVDLELINLRISSAEIGLNPFELNESE